MLTGLTFASPAAINNCAPYGMIPCMQHEKVSRILAHLRLSRPYLSPIFFASPPVVRMATVLFAVHRLTMLTSVAIDSSAPRLPLMCVPIFSII